MNILKRLTNRFRKRLDMSQINTSLNCHIEDYLNYYCGLSNSPKFAVLLKGKWGSGKTWFINQYREKLSKKSLYVSLYGVTNYTEIEDSLFKQLNPIRSSKGVVLAEKIFTGIILKSLLRFDLDLNHDSTTDGAVTVSIPDIVIPEKFKDSNFSFLIFDDLERCNINIEDILGYINSFVESQDLKVVIIANEDEIDTKQEKYKRIKEKLIGKTFEVVPDFSEGLKYFLSKLQNQGIREFLSDNIKLIQELYRKAECKNLRLLYQISLDFERIFEILPEKAKSKPELLKEILELLIIFSIEISYGTIKPRDISQIVEKMSQELADLHLHKKTLDLDLQETNNKDKIINNKDKISLLQIFEKYYHIYSINNPFSNQPLPSLLWWEHFFDKGIVDKVVLEESIINSKYFQDETTPNWLRLWHYDRCNDQDFQIILDKVESEYINREFEDIGVIQHITGLFLVFSDAKLYNKSKQDIINESKIYIDELRESGRLDLKYTSDNIFSGYMGLGFQAVDYQEFQDLVDHIKVSQEKLTLQNMSDNAKRLLDIMQTNISEFHSIICESGSYGNLELQYHHSPIFSYILPDEFIQIVLKLPNENILRVFSSIKERYKLSSTAKILVNELDFLKDIQRLLLLETSEIDRKLSRHLLWLSNKQYLEKTITNLENIKNI